MENENKRANGRTDAPDQWQNAEHQGDWQLAESDESDTAEMLTAYQTDENSPRLYATGGDPDEEDNDDNDDEDEEPRDWGHTDPLDSPLPDSNDPSGPGSAV
jgi:hypothetical protein